MRKIGRSLLPVIVAALAAATASAQDKKKLDVIVFPGGHNWPIWAAQKNGAFAAGGIEVTVHAVVPALGIGGPAIELDVSGHAVEESR